MKRALILLSLIMCVCHSGAQNFLVGTDYYIKSEHRQMFLSGGNEWGTHAVVARHGIPWRLELIGNNVYALDSRVSNGAIHYLGSNNYVDAGAVGMTLEDGGNGSVVFRQQGSDFVLTTSPQSTDVSWNLVAPDRSMAHWRLYSRADMLAGFATATAAEPVDATFLISAPNFSRGHDLNAMWQGSSPQIGGDNTNFVARHQCASFDTYQQLTDLPNGIYLVLVQGYCHNNSGKPANMAELYANSASTPLADAFSEGIATGREIASRLFSAGLYTQRLVVEVKDGKLRVGVRKKGGLNDDYTVFDNFELYYAGNEADGEIIVPEDPQVEPYIPQPATLRQLTDVPTVYINTYDGLGISSKDVYSLSTMWMIEGEDTTRYDSLKIRGRGNSTWNLEKKPYRLKFDKKEKLLGKKHANAKNWVLMANHADKTLLRNATAAFIGEQLGLPFNPGARFADLVLNDTYLGSYQITDFIDIRKHRVDITEQDTIAVEGSDITGGYLIEADGFAGGEAVNFRSSWGVPIEVKSPDEDVINQAQINYIRDFVNTFEKSLDNKVFKDAQLGYRSHVDTLSLAAWVLGTEFTANVDGYYSVYLYKEQQDDHLYFGPLWDYDIAFNNCNRIGDVTRRLMMTSGFGTEVVRPWVERMYQDPWFKQLLHNQWQKAIGNRIVDKTLAYIDSMAQVIDKSQALNATKWPLTSHVYNEITLYSTYLEGVEYMKRFVSNHALYLCEVFDVDPEYVTPQPETGIDDQPSELEYRILCDPTSRQVRLIQPYGSQAEGVMTLYTIDGKRLASVSVSDILTVPSATSAIYILQWTIGKDRKSIKFHL